MLIRRLLAAVVLVAALWGCGPPKTRALITHRADLRWPAPPQAARIRYLGQVRGSRQQQGVADVVAGQAPGKWLARPYGVTTTPAGVLVVADPGAGEVNLFDISRRRHLVLASHGETRLQSPVGVASDGEGRIYVTDSRLRRVLVYDQRGAPVAVHGAKLGRPTGVAVDRRRGVFYVADTTAHRVHAWSTAGKYLRGFGVRGAGPGQFNYPTHLAYSAALDRLLVCDTLNFRVQLMTHDGKPAGAFGQLGDSTGYMAKPKGVAADSRGNIYVADALFDAIQIFNQRGRLLLYFGRAGRGKGQLGMPAGIHVDEQDRIFVANSLNRRIEIFQLQGADKTKGKSP